MKSLEFDDLPGKSPIEKYDYLLAQSPNSTVYVQEKKNGIGVRIHVRGREPFIETRNGKFYPEGYFSPLPLWKLANPDANYKLYAELYSADPQIPLATFAGGMSVNRQSADEHMLHVMRFWVYDTEQIAEPGNFCILAFSTRNALLRTQHRFLPADLVDVAPTLAFASSAALESHWQTIADDPTKEGFIYRVDPCYHHDGSPTYMQVKRTRMHTAEGTCIGITAGKGKRTGLLGSFQILLDNGRVFSLGGGTGLNDDMLAYYHDHPPLHRKITFSYKETSAFGLPLRAQFVAVRDYE